MSLCRDADVEENEPSPKGLKKKQKRVSVKQVRFGFMFV